MKKHKLFFDGLSGDKVSSATKLTREPTSKEEKAYVTYIKGIYDYLIQRGVSRQKVNAVLSFAHKTFKSFKENSKNRNLNKMRVDDETFKNSEIQKPRGTVGFFKNRTLEEDEEVQEELREYKEFLKNSKLL